MITDENLGKFRIIETRNPANYTGKYEKDVVFQKKADILLMTGTLMTLLIQILHREMIQEILVIYPIKILVMLLMMVRIPVTILIRNWMTVVPEIPEMIP